MKKKIYLTVLCVIMALISLCGCSLIQEVTDVYAELNKMAEVTYTKFTVDVASTMNGSELKSRYEVSISGNTSNISYSYEKLNTFEIVEGELIAPEEYKTVKTGTLVVKGDKIIEQNGEKIDISVDKITSPKLTFEKSYFRNVSDEKGNFSADVTNVSGFIGKEIKCSDMSTTIKYSNGKFTSVTISYTSEKGANIVIRYTL